MVEIVRVVGTPPPPPEMVITASPLASESVAPTNFRIRLTTRVAPCLTTSEVVRLLGDMIHLLLTLACAPDTTTERETLSLPGLVVVELRAPCDNSGTAVIEDPRLTEAVMLTTLRYVYADGSLEYNNSTRWTLTEDGTLTAFCYADADLVVQMLLRQE